MECFEWACMCAEWGMLRRGLESRTLIPLKSRTLHCVGVCVCVRVCVRVTVCANRFVRAGIWGREYGML